MKILLFFLTLLSLFFVSSKIAAQTPLDSKVQSWNEVQLIVPLRQKTDSKDKKVDTITATFNGILRIGRKNWDFIDNRIGIALDFRANKYFSFLTSVLYRKDELNVGRRNYETRLDFGFLVSKTVKKMAFRDRNLYEHRFRNSREDTNFYRNRLQVTYPIFRNGKEIFAPFISEEGYYDLSMKKWTQNEFFAGISRKLTKKITLDLAYIRFDGNPVNVNGLSTNLRIKFK